MEKLAASRNRNSPDFVVAYSDMNSRFHALSMDLAGGCVLLRAWSQVQAIPGID